MISEIDWLVDMLLLMPSIKQWINYIVFFSLSSSMQDATVCSIYISYRDSKQSIKMIKENHCCQISAMEDFFRTTMDNLWRGSAMHLIEDTVTQWWIS